MSSGALGGAALSEFLGRRREMDELEALLESRRLVTIVGPGGAGKTRLALETIRRLDDPVVVVELAPVGDGRLVPGTILDAVGVGEQPPGDLLDVAAGMLANDPVVLVLDNCEHVRDAAAEAAAGLLAACPGLRVLTTSRAPLGVDGEVTWLIPPLEDDTAVALFIARAADVRPGAASAEETVVRAICRELDGMPLAIELAAARTRMLTAQEIAAGLTDRLRLLVAPRAAEPRRRSVRGSLDWSYDLLDEPARLLFRRLSVFAGGWTLAAAENVCAGDPLDRGDVFDLLSALVDQSLVIADHDGAQTRFHMLESMRAYAAEQLAAAGEERAICCRHLGYFLSLASSERDIGREEANVRAAIANGLRHDPPQAVRLATAAHFWWVVSGRYREGLDTLERGLAFGGAELPAAERATAYAAASYFAHHAGDFARAAEYGRQALALAEESGDAYALGCACITLGNALAIARSPADGLPLLERAVSVLTEAAPTGWALFLALGSLGANGLLADRLDRVREVAAALREVPTEGFEAYAQGWIHAIPAMADFQQGRFRAALDHAAQAFEGDPVRGTVSRATAFAAWTLARAHTGEAEPALRDVLDEIERVSRLGARFGLARLHHAAATTELALGAVDAAAERSANWRDAAHVVMAANHREILARAALARDDSRAAREAALALREAAGRTGARLHGAGADYVLGRVALIEGEWRQARERLHAALSVQWEIGSQWRTCETLEALAAVALDARDAVGAARLLAAVGAARAALGAVPVPPEEAWREALPRRAREVAGEEAFAAAWADGQTMELAAAVGWARRMRGARDRPLTGWDSLTPAERRVAELAVEGLSNPEIGERLFISPGTAKLHLSRVYAKLNVRNRAALAAAAARRPS